MAFYIMRKLADGMLGEGERQYPKLVRKQTVEINRIARDIEKHTTFTRGDVVGVLSELAAVVEEQLAQGNSVKIEGLGTLSPVLGLVDKESRGEWSDGANRYTTGRNVRLKTVNFHPEAVLMHKLEHDMTLERVGNCTNSKQPTTSVEERAAIARQYIGSHGFMRIADYAELTGLSKVSASKELRALAADETSGIAADGKGAAKVYIIPNI